MTINVVKVTTGEQLQKSFDIRIEVFVNEQGVRMEEEIDEFENDSIHFLAFIDEVACGAARWRFTNNGAKLERFAVLEEYRGQGAASQLVQVVIDDIKSHDNYSGQLMYLNAQIEAMPLYEKFGFEPEGEEFMECDIRHMKMILKR